MSTAILTRKIRHKRELFDKRYLVSFDAEYINAMTDAGHPCEVISEAFTILERRGKLDGLRLTFVGEDTNLCRSWCELTTIFDLSVTQVCPPG